MATVGASGGRGLNFTANLNISEAKRNAAELAKIYKDLKIQGNDIGLGKDASKGFDVKPLTEYQAGLLRIKEEALNFAKAKANDDAETKARLLEEKKLKQEQSTADKTASLALQNALKDERLARESILTQIAQNKLAQQQANAEAKAAADLQRQTANQKRPTQVSNSQAEIDAYNRAARGSIYYTSAINAQIVAESKLTTVAAAQAAATGNLSLASSSSVNATKQDTAATNENANVKKLSAAQLKELAIQLAAEKLRMQQSTAETKNNAREQLNAKGSIEQRKAALERLLTVYNRLSVAERESAAGNRLASIIAGLRDQIKNLDDQTKNSKLSISDLFDQFKNKILSVLAPLALLTAAWETAKAVFNNNVSISDNFTDVQRTAKLSKEEVREFGKELKNLDTRTSLEGLLDIGFIGGRLAVPKKDLEDFVKQVDELAVVLKKEFPGGAEAVAESLGKIVTIYKVTQKEGVSLGTALSKVGSNLLELAHSGPVTVKFLQDFTLGVAGTAASAKLSIPVISAYGAILGESGQIASSSALSVTRLVTGLTTKTGKYAAIAQLADSTLTVEKFTKIVNTDTKQALDLFFKGLKAGNPVATEFAARLGSVGITTGKVTNAVKILAENQDKLANRIDIGTKAFDESTSVAHNFELANDNLAASVDKLHNAAVNLTTDPNSALAGFFKGIIDGSTFAIKAISDLNDALSKTQNEKDQELVSRSKPTLFSSIFGSGAAIDPIELAAAKARIKATVTKSLNDDIAGKGFASADIMAAGKDELQIRKLLTGEINKQKIAVDRLGNALAFVSDPKNTEAQTASVEKSINRLRVAARQQSAVVAGLRNKLPKDLTVYGDGSLVDQEQDGKSPDAMRAEIKALETANNKLGKESTVFKANIIKINGLKKELKIALGGKDTEAISAENQYATALKARNDLQSKITELVKKGTDKQLSADDQEVESVKDKYAKMREEAIKFNNDPKNTAKGLKVNTSGLVSAQKIEIQTVYDKQSNVRFKQQLDDQTKDFEAVEDYRKKYGQQAAQDRYTKELNISVETYQKQFSSAEAYAQKLEDIQTDILNKNGDPSKYTDGQKQQLSIATDQINAFAEKRKAIDAANFAEAYQSALTNSQVLLGIEADYQKKRNALGSSATEDQLKNLQREKEERIRNQNEANAVQKSGYSDLMKNMDEMTRGEVLKRLNIIKSGYQEEYKAGKITAEQLSKLTSDINSHIDSLNGNNAFNKISESVKRYKEALKTLPKDSIGVKDSQKEMYDSFAEGAEAASAGISGLSGVFDQLGIGGEKLQVVLKDVSGILSGAGEISKGIASKDPVAIVTGSIKLLSSAIDLFNGKDRKLQRQIDAYKTQLDSLGKAYAQLERDVNNSVGESIYSDQSKQIQNLKDQQADLIKMRDAERSKKKSDQGKIADYQNQIDEIPGKIDDINKAISQNLIQTNFKDLSNNLADAFSDAFASAEDSAKNFDDVFNKVIVNAVKNSLKLKILDPIVKKFTDDLTAYAQGHDNSVIGFDFEKYRALLKAGGDLVTAGLDKIKNYFPDLPVPDPTTPNGIQGTITAAGLTEDTGNELKGIFRGTYDQTKLGVKTMGDIYQMSVNQFNTSLEIAANTKRGADNTDGIGGKLDKIIANTSSGSAGDPFRNAGINLG